MIEYTMMSNKPNNLSVIVVCTNEEKYIKPCLSSLKIELQGLDSEIIVIDNNSSDASRDIINADFPEVILISNKKNRGAAYARNLGIELATGKYLAFLDCDT